MMIRSLQSHLEKAANAFFSSNQETKIESLLLSLLILFIPTELGKHFWPDFAIIAGIRVDYLSPTLYFTDVLIFLLFGVWFLRKVRSAKVSVQSYTAAFKSFNGKLISAVVVFFFINISLSNNFLNGLYHLVKLLEFAFVGVYVASVIKKPMHVTRIVLLLSIGIIFESCLAIGQFIHQGSFGGIFYFFGERLFTGATPGIANASISGELLLRPYGTFSHPNVLAGYLVCSMVLILFLFNHVTERVLPEAPSRRARPIIVLRAIGIPSSSVTRLIVLIEGLSHPRVLMMAALLFGTAGLLLSMSRVAIVIWLFFLGVLFLSQVKTVFAKQGKLWIASFLVVVSLLLVGFTSTPVAGRLVQSNFGEEAVVERVALSQASITLFSGHPFLGVGLGNFLPSLVTVQKFLTGAAYLQPVHNIFLLTLVETGVVGLGLALSFLVLTYKRLLSVIQQDPAEHSIYRAFLVVLTVVLILGSADHYFLTLQQGQLLFSLILGLCWTTLRD